VITVRYFAAAAEAAGLDAEQVPAGDGAALRADLVARHPALGPILGRCALLADGRRIDAADEVAPGATLDVLPPFAGG
jgi:sulfur-carrier protein